jgi:S-adenosylmethionine:tRNA ribosyltransferase-isomerase
VLVHLRASKAPKAGSRLRLADAFDAEVLGRGGDAGSADGALYRLRFPSEPHALLERHGHVPLPPYIAHADGSDDVERYQTVFAARPGAVAAPTAALHIDADVLERLRGRGIGLANLTLHVGAGTFQPVRTETSMRTACTASGSRFRSRPSMRSRARGRRRPHRRDRHDDAAGARVGRRRG